jgi:hypothetical protein
MQISVDNLMVALLIVLAPEPEQGVDRAIDSLLTAESQAGQQNQLSGAAEDPSACRYFVDPDARRKCAIRTSRMPTPAAGVAAPTSSHPETVIWLTPNEPRMPFAFGATGAR